jgi:hypothetical protein
VNITALIAVRKPKILCHELLDTNQGVSRHNKLTRSCETLGNAADKTSFMVHVLQTTRGEAGWEVVRLQRRML